MAYEVWLPPIELQRTMVVDIERTDRIRQCREQSQRRVGALISAALNEAFAALS